MAIRQRASVVCIHQDKILSVRLEDPTTKVRRWFLPGGQIDEGETSVVAAIRETLEETGYRISVDESSALFCEYPFEWDGQIVQCETTFFRGFLINPGSAPAKVEDAEYHRGVAWLSCGDLKSWFGFHKEIYEAIAELCSSEA